MEKTLLFKGRDRMGATLKSCWPVKDSSKPLTFEICKHVSFRAKITFYYVKDYANFRQRSYIVAYLSPTFLSAPSGLDVASFFILSFFDMFPSFFPF